MSLILLESVNSTKTTKFDAHEYFWNCSMQQFLIILVFTFLFQYITRTRFLHLMVYKFLDRHLPSRLHISINLHWVPDLIFPCSIHLENWKIIFKVMYLDVYIWNSIAVISAHYEQLSLQRWFQDSFINVFH